MTLCTYIETEVIGNHRLQLVSALLEMHKAEYVRNGGDEVDIASYSARNLLRKVTNVCGQLINHNESKSLYSTSAKEISFIVLSCQKMMEGHDSIQMQVM